MALSFKNSHNSIFSGQAPGATRPIQKAATPEPPPTELKDFLRFYPLTPGAQTRQHSGNSAYPVPPLSQRPQHPLNPLNPLHRAATPTAPSTPPVPKRATVPPQHRQPPLPPNQASLPQAAPMPHPMQSVQSPQPPQSPQSPQSAAEQFRRINKNLPDGVMYEPLDEDIMRLLKDNGHIKQSPTPQPTASAPLPSTPHTAAPTQPIPAPHTNPPNYPTSMPHHNPPQPPTQPSQPIPPAPTIALEPMIAALKALAQDEENSKIFYTNLATQAPTDPLKKALADLAIDCESRKQNYMAILKENFSQDFTPETKAVNTNVSYREGITLAQTEENKALTTLGSLLDQAKDTTLERQLERIVYRKIIRYQLLTGL